jgi:putative hydrolase of the HAD superfamily
MTAPTHVLFDFFGTLVTYSASRVEQGFQRSHELVRANGARIDYAVFLESWNTVFDEFEAKAANTHEEYSMDAVCRAFLSQTLPCAPDDQTLALFRDTYLDEWNRGVSPISGVDALLAELGARFELALVTNTHDAAFVHAHLRTLNIAQHFDVVVTSVEHGKRKPSACIFEQALVRAEGQAESSVYVGDSYAADYVGASGAGIRCLLIDPANRHDVPVSDRLDHVLEVRDRLLRDV